MANSKAFHGISEADLGSVAAEIAPFLKGGGLVTLNGDLGMGKTAFARALIRHLTNAGEDVPSPTYTLLQTYNAPNMSIWHFDLYRLKSPDEVYELGWEDAVAPGNLVLIEWPERIEDLLPSHTSIHFAAPTPTTRDITVTYAT